MKSSRILVSAVLISYQARFSSLFITLKDKISDVELVKAATTKLAFSVGYFTKLLKDSLAITSLNIYASI